MDILNYENEQYDEHKVLVHIQLLKEYPESVIENEATGAVGATYNERQLIMLAIDSPEHHYVVRNCEFGRT